jgi:SecD/SecF fusion protein
MAGSTTLLIILAALVVAVVCGVLLARMWRVRESTARLIVVLSSVFAGLAVTAAGWPPKAGVDLRGGTILIYDVRGDVPSAQPLEAQDESPQGPEAKRLGMKELIAAVSRRVNPGGVKEVTIRPHGAKRIEIIVPESDQQEIERLKRILGNVGTLEFRILANQRDDKLLIDRTRTENDPELRSEQGKLLAWWVPVARDQEGIFRKYPEIAMRTVPRGADKVAEVLVIKDDSNVTGSHLSQAIAGVNPRGGQSVRYHLDPTGGQGLGNLTGSKLPDEVGSFTRKLGIIINGQLYSAPPITEAMFQDGEIAGNFTQQQLKDLADVLNAGALPKALSAEPIHQLITGPAMGRDTIRHGVVAVGLSLALVFVLLLVFYRFAGLVACGALLVNLLLIVAILIVIKMAITLPSLAGLLLALATVVGAQVLIFERIREELDRQSPLRTAIRNGFSKAQSAILDSGATVLILATALFLMGTEQTKGFAVTLWLGLALGWLATVYGSRVVFDIAERRRWITQLTMMRLPIRSDINFLGHRSIAGIASAAAVAISLVGVYLCGPDLLNVDFTGGVRVETVFRQPQTVAEVRRGLSALPDVSVCDVQAAGEAPGVRFLVTSSTPAGRSAEDHLKQVNATIQKAFGDKLAHTRQPSSEKTMFSWASTVGGKVGGGEQERAVGALLVGLLCIVGYLWLRFQRANYGLAAMLALAHDMAITLGLFALSHYVAPYVGFLLIEPFKIGLPVVAALVTIAGFSLTGTVVVFDRIRESRGKMPLLTEEKVNASLNQTLGRTLMTSLLVLLVAVVLYIIGGPGIHAFAFALVVGTIAATYSSIYVAAPFLLWMSQPAVNIETPSKSAAGAPRASKSTT